MSKKERKGKERKEKKRKKSWDIKFHKKKEKKNSFAGGDRKGYWTGDDIKACLYVDRRGDDNGRGGWCRGKERDD